MQLDPYLIQKKAEGLIQQIFINKYNAYWSEGVPVNLPLVEM